MHKLTIPLFLVFLLILTGCSSLTQRETPQVPAPSSDDQAAADILKKAQEAAASGTPPEVADEQIAKELFASCNLGEKQDIGEGLVEVEYFGKQTKTINGQTYEVCYFTQTDLRIKDHPDLDIRQTATAHFYYTENLMLAKDGGIGYKTYIDETGTNRIIIERLSHTKGLCTAEVNDPAPVATNFITVIGEPC